MKSLLKALILLSPLICFGQKKVYVYNTYEIFNGDTINEIINGNKEGKWIEFDGIVSSTNCYSKSEYINEKSFSSLINKGTYKDGKQVGKWEFYYQTGEIKRIIMYSEKGVKTGRSIEYYENGQIKSTQEYLNGKVESQKIYSRNNKLQFETNILEDGNYSFSIYYQSGELKYKGTKLNNWEIENLKHYSQEGISLQSRRLKFGELMALEKLIEYL